ncbi:MAG: hypothetical protein POELPBGB_02320 [Bacteroidia bacterium]|nr:hypothetical protein [Bacteroidia bacterium]
MVFFEVAGSNLLTKIENKIADKQKIISLF